MRKLMMITAMALAAIAFGSMTATATAGEGVYVWDDNSGTEDYCPEVYESDGEVTGGCLIQGYDGSFELGLFNPNWTTVDRYGLKFDFAVNGSGDGYLVNPVIHWFQYGWGRKACDEADGTPLPWPVQSRVVGNEIHMDITMALTPSSTPPGGSCTQQTITVEYGDLGGGNSEFTQVGQSANIKDGYWQETTDDGSYMVFSLYEQW